MLRWMLGLALALAPASIPRATGQTTRATGQATPAISIQTELAPLFSRARTDPAGIVSLVLAGSAALLRLDGAEALQLADTLEPFCRRAFFGPEQLPGMESLGLRLHVVRKGEVPERIARGLRIDAGLLSLLNRGFDERRLREGQELKVLDLSDKSLALVVQKGRWRLCAWREVRGGGRALVMCAPVGLGAASSPTPEGRTSVVLRARDPEWTDPVTRRVYPPGDPGNVLGGFWIALDAQGLGRSGIGLHGFTGDAPENWIGQPASQGCVRLLQPDVERVFRIALEGTPVTIQP